MYFDYQRIKDTPIIGPVAILIHRFILLLCRLGLFGETKKQDANQRFFRRFITGVSRGAPHPLFVKVGANDGVTDDPCTDILIADPAWRGLFIEPVPYLFDKLKQNFPDRKRFMMEQMAVGAAGQASFYFIDPTARGAFPDLPDWFDQVGSFDRNHINKHFGSKLDAFVREKVVEVQPLSQVLARHYIEDCHLLHIDTEGHDFKVLATLDFKRVKPQAIFVEYKHLSVEERAAMIGMLQKESYCIHDCGGDFFALLKA